MGESAETIMGRLRGELPHGRSDGGARPTHTRTAGPAARTVDRQDLPRACPLGRHADRKRDPIAMELPIDPDDHTVAELTDALEDLGDPRVLAAVREAERAGADRTTAVEAIDHRLQMVGADPDAMTTESLTEDAPVPSPEELPTPPGEDAAAGDRAAVEALTDAEELLTLAGPDQGEALSERLLANLDGIRTTLEDARQTGGRYDARLRKLENQIGDLSAYTTALEEFLDEEGTGRQVIESVRTDIDAIEDDVQDIALVVRSHARNLRSIRESITALEGDLDSQADGLDRVAADVEMFDVRIEEFRETAAETHEAHADRLVAVEESANDHDGRIDGLADEVERVNGAVDDVRGEVRRLDGAVEDELAVADDERAELAEHVESNANGLDDLAAKVGEVAADVGDIEDTIGDPGRVDERFDRLQGDVERLLEWREQLGSVMTGVVGSPAESED